MEKYYRILDLYASASEQEVKQAYRELVKVWHPDRFTHDIKLQKRAEEKLKEINDAYQRVMDSLNNSSTRQQSQQYQRTDKREKRESQPPPKQPFNSWICPNCLRTNYMDNFSCGCGFRTTAAEIEAYKADKTAADLYEAILFNRNMNYMDRAAFLSRYLLIRFPNSKEAEYIKQGAQHSTSSAQSNNHVRVCQRCGQHRVIFRGAFHENISYFFRRQERTIDAELCLPCMSKVFVELTGKTLFLTWWGIIGMILGPFYIMQNIAWFLFNTYRFLRHKSQKSAPLNTASADKTYKEELSYSIKKWVIYLVFGFIVITVIISALNNPAATKKQDTARHEVPIQFKPTTRVVAQKPAFDAPVQPLPVNGAIKRYVNDEAIAPLKIVTRDNSNHYYVKIVDWYTKKKICTVFIRSGQTVSLDVPLGTYRLRYATGEKWYGTKLLFGPETAYSEADQQLDFEVRGEQVHGYTVELYLRPNGNLKTNRIAAGEFEENDDR